MAVLPFLFAACASRTSDRPNPPSAEAPAFAPTPADSEARSEDEWLPEDAAAGVDDPALAELLKEHWSWVLGTNPLWATQLGVHRFDDRIEDESEAAELRELEVARRFLARVRALSSSQTLSDRDRLTLAIFEFEAESAVATAPCQFFRWSLDPRYNLFTRYARIPKIHPLETKDDALRLLARYRQIPRELSHHTSNLRTGVERGFVANAQSTGATAALIEDALGEPPNELPFMEPLRAPRPGWPENFRSEFSRELTRVVVDEIVPAFKEYARFLRTEIVPRARGESNEGILGIPTGEACYAALVREHTTTDAEPGNLHRVGLSELDRINAEMRTLGKKVFGTDDLTAIVERLRNDSSLFFDSGDAILHKAQSALDAAKRALPAFFSLVPEARCVVVPIPEYEARAATLAYYRPPHPDGSKPGEFFVNTADAERRRRFELEVLTFHESIPGHHLQIAIAQELGELPAFRKHGGATAFVEGWGLYAERLAGEMGLYTSELDHMGRLSFEAWRAARLVVDTGIHSMRWTRERAIELMMARTALSRQNVENEVDRYIVTPGQALAYKVGQLEILRLRGRAEAELGERFDIEEFHAAVLSQGALTLPLLAERIERFIVAKKH